MNSRLKKYYDEDEQVLPSRQSKNMELYKQINTTEIDDFNLDSNASVIDDDGNNIDIQKVRDILDQRYQKTPKNKNLAEFEEEVREEIKLDETREYDINTILEKAKEEKEDNYEVERLKKVRPTQFDILNNLNLGKKPEDTNELPALKEDENLKDTQVRLMELINTITSKELNVDKKKTIENTDDIDPLDILTDLKGNDNTIVVPAIKEENLKEIKEEIIKENKEEIQVKNTEKPKEETEKEVLKEPKKDIEKPKQSEEELSKSLTLTSDFEDFKDLKEDMKTSNVFIKILTIIVILLLIAGIIFMLNSIFNWGLF